MRMLVVFALVGLIVGGVIGEAGGALGGAALGYAIGLHLAYRRRLAALEEELGRLAAEHATRAPPPPASDNPWLRRPVPAVASRDYFAAPPPSPAAPEPPPAPAPATATAVDRVTGPAP